MFADPEHALDTLIREELGLDPDELGSPIKGGRRLVRRVRHRGGHPGDPVPVRRRDRRRSLVSIGLSLVAMFAVGAGVSLLTGRGLIFSGFRQVGDRAGRGRRDVPGRPAHRRGRGLSGPDPMADLTRTASCRRSRPHGWSNGPGDRYAAHDHGYDKVIVVERGSIRFGLPGRARRTRQSTSPRATASSCRRARATTPSSARVAWPVSRRTGRPGPSIGSLAARPGRGEGPSGRSGVGYRLAEGNPMDAPARMP